jgi:hypothetical protein
LVDEFSKPEDFIIVESRKKRREKKKNIKISPVNKSRGLNPKKCDPPKRRGRPCKASSLNPGKDKKK